MKSLPKSSIRFAIVLSSFLVLAAISAAQLAAPLPTGPQARCTYQGCSQDSDCTNPLCQMCQIEGVVPGICSAIK